MQPPTANIRVKQSWSMITVILGVLVSLTVLHAYLVVPRIIHEARIEWRNDLDVALRDRNTVLEGIVNRLNRLDDKFDRVLMQQAGAK